MQLVVGESVATTTLTTMVTAWWSAGLKAVKAATKFLKNTTNNGKSW